MSILMASYAMTVLMASYGTVFQGTQFGKTGLIDSLLPLHFII